MEMGRKRAETCGRIDGAAEGESDPSEGSSSEENPDTRKCYKCRRSRDVIGGDSEDYFINICEMCLNERSDDDDDAYVRSIDTSKPGCSTFARRNSILANIAELIKNNDEIRGTPDWKSKVRCNNENIAGLKEKLAEVPVLPPLSEQEMRKMLKRANILLACIDVMAPSVAIGALLTRDLKGRIRALEHNLANSAGVAGRRVPNEITLVDFVCPGCRCELRLATRTETMLARRSDVGNGNPWRNARRRDRGDAAVGGDAGDGAVGDDAGTKVVGHAGAKAAGDAGAMAVGDAGAGALAVSETPERVAKQRRTA